MALVNCPECNESISQKASVCPHCGYPMKPEEEATQYELQKETASDSYGASFMRAMAWIIWIGGLVLAIASSIGSEDYGYYSSRTTFNWGKFFTVGGTYAVYGDGRDLRLPAYEEVDELAHAAIGAPAHDRLDGV